MWKFTELEVLVGEHRDVLSLHIFIFDVEVMAGIPSEL
jgi:hypothetical protein